MTKQEMLKVISEKHPMYTSQSYFSVKAIKNLERMSEDTIFYIYSMLEKK